MLFDNGLRRLIARMQHRHDRLAGRARRCLFGRWLERRREQQAKDGTFRGGRGKFPVRAQPARPLEKEPPDQKARRQKQSCGGAIVRTAAKSSIAWLDSMKNTTGKARY